MTLLVHRQLLRAVHEHDSRIIPVHRSIALDTGLDPQTDLLIAERRDDKVIAAKLKGHYPVTLIAGVGQDDYWNGALFPQGLEDGEALHDAVSQADRPPSAVRL